MRARHALAAVLALGALLLPACGSSGARAMHVVRGPGTPPAVRGTLVDAPSPRWTVAAALGAEVPLYSKPGVRMPDRRVLANPTIYGLPLVFLVRELVGGWARVQIPVRPNGAEAWVRRSDLVIGSERYRIEVRLGAHRLRLFDGRKVVATMNVAGGASSSPTPVGHFYVDAKVRLTDPTGPYGAGQVSVTGFSDVYQTFGGGPGQMAIHGTNEPNLIGQAVSHGCVRVNNEQVLRLLNTVPLGAPVDILA